MEQTLSYPYRQGYNFDVEHARLDIYRLINQFLSQVETNKLIQSDACLEEAIDSVGHYFDVETQRILISAAIVARVIDDGEEQQNYKLHNYQTVCGSLLKDTSKPNNKCVLTLREACNKIIHAAKYTYDIDEETKAINPIIYLHGSYNNKSWKVTLNIIDFSKEYLRNVLW